MLSPQIINVYSGRHSNYPDLIILQCIHALKYHTVPHKYVQLLCINYKFFKVLVKNITEITPVINLLPKFVS